MIRLNELTQTSKIEFLRELVDIAIKRLDSNKKIKAERLLEYIHKVLKDLSSYDDDIVNDGIEDIIKLISNGNYITDDEEIYYTVDLLNCFIAISIRKNSDFKNLIIFRDKEEAYFFVGEKTKNNPFK